MYCKFCGKELLQGAAVCVQCGAPVGAGNAYCPFCGNTTAPGAAVCVSCGRQLNANPAAVPGQEQKSKLTAGLLALFLGFGVYNFYLGYTGKAVTQLILDIVGILLSLVFVGFFIVMGVSIWQLVEGIMILTGKIDRDGKGVPLAQ